MSTNVQISTHTNIFIKSQLDVELMNLEPHGDGYGYVLRLGEGRLNLFFSTAYDVKVFQSSLNTVVESVIETN